MIIAFANSTAANLRCAYCGWRPLTVVELQCRIETHKAAAYEYATHAFCKVQSLMSSFRQLMPIRWHCCQRAGVGSVTNKRSLCSSQRTPFVRAGPNLRRSEQSESRSRSIQPQCPSADEFRATAHGVPRWTASPPTAVLNRLSQPR